MATIDPKLRAALTGISGILVTPFDADDKVAPSRLKPIIDRAIGAGVHILVANGNTGEFYGLTTAEAETMVRSVAEQIGGRVPLLGGVGRSIGDACALAKVSREAGASALMVHQPPDPFVSPRGVVDYVERVAGAGGGLPLMLYLRNDGIGLDTIEALCRLEGVAGVKWASPDPASAGGGDPPLQPRHRLGRRPRRDLGPASLRGRRARLHVRPDQRVAGALGRDPRRLGGRELPEGEPAHRGDARIRGDPRGGAERYQRHRSQGRLAAYRRRLRTDPAALGLAAHRKPDGKATQVAGGLGSRCVERGCAGI